MWYPPCKSQASGASTYKGKTSFILHTCRHCICCNLCALSSIRGEYQSNVLYPFQYIWFSHVCAHTRRIYFSYTCHCLSLILKGLVRDKVLCMSQISQGGPEHWNSWFFEEGYILANILPDGSLMVMLTVWEGLWLWCPCEAAGQTFACHVSNRRRATGCCFSGTIFELHSLFTGPSVWHTLMLWWLAKWSGDDANISPQFLLLIIELLNHVSHQLTMQILVFFLRWRWCEIKHGTHSSGDYCNLQVLVADINIGYEDIVNTQVYIISVGWFTLYHLSHSYCNSFSLALTCEHGNF